MINAVLAYIRHNGKTLMMYRNKKKDDIHEGKWNGVGGKMEVGESPEDALHREVQEETSLTILNAKLRGHITFPAFAKETDWHVFLFEVYYFSGSLGQCEEGELHWIDDEKILQLNMWEGDYLFFEWLRRNEFFLGKIVYKNGRYVSNEVTFY